MNSLAGFFAAPPSLLEHAPALLVLGPLIGACVAALSPSARFTWLVSFAAALFAFWMSLGVAGEVARRGVVEYHHGGFPPPIGIAFRIDALGALFVVLISGIAAATAFFSGHSLRAEVRESKRGLFQGGFLLCVAGLLGMAATGDAFNAFVFLEISSIGTYALIGIGDARDRRALPAAFNYLIMGTIGATFFVVGIGFIYAETGTLNMVDMALRLPEAGETPAVQAGFAFIVVGLGLKAAMFPLHGWLPAAYSHAPSMMNVFLSATATKASLYLMVRFIFDVFGVRFDFVQEFLGWVLAPLGGVAALVCSAQAIFQTEIRRMLAFSTVAQVGYVMLVVGVGTSEAVSAGLLHLVAQSFIKAAMFMAIGGLAVKSPAIRLNHFAGAGIRAPFTTAAFCIGALSLAGVPLTFGFLSKWRLFEASVVAGQFWIVVVLAAASVLSIIYIGRILEVMYFRPAPEGAEPAREAPLGALAPLWALALTLVWFGVNAGFVESFTAAGAAAVAEVGP